MTYRIIRSYKDNRPKEIVATGLSLDQAKDRCDVNCDEDGWFDSYEPE